MWYYIRPKELKLNNFNYIRIDTKGCTGSEIALELGKAALHKWNICYEKCNVYSTLLEKNTDMDTIKMSNFRAKPNWNTKIVNSLQTEEAVFWLSAHNPKLLNFFSFTNLKNSKVSHVHWFTNRVRPARWRTTLLVWFFVTTPQLFPYAVLPGDDLRCLDLTSKVLTNCVLIMKIALL